MADSQPPNSRRALPNGFPLPETYHGKHTDAVIRLGFGAARLPVGNILGLLLVCQHDVAEKIHRDGEEGEMEWDTAHRQLFAQDLGDDIRLTVLNLAGHRVLWRELRSVLEGLEEYLVDGRRGREVMFRFRIGGGPEVGWGFVAKGGGGGHIPRPPHGVDEQEEQRLSTCFGLLDSRSRDPSQCDDLTR